MITGGWLVFVVVVANLCYLGLWADHLRFRKYRWKGPITRDDTTTPTP